MRRQTPRRTLIPSAGRALAGMSVTLAVAMGLVPVGPAGAALPTRSLYTAGNAAFHGSTGDAALNGPLVDMASAPKGGYWQLGSDGGVFSFGGAPFYGSTGDIKLNQPVVSMSPTRTGAGYWFVARDGGVFNYGDAAFYGSTGDIALNQPVVGMAPTSTGKGYLLVAGDGGVFTFGDAKFSGSLGDRAITAPIVSLTPHPSGNGYWLLDRDGEVYPFGAAEVHGVMYSYSRKVVLFTDIQTTPTGDGYWTLDESGAVLAHGDATRLEPEVTLGPGQRAIGVASTRDGRGLWVTTTGWHVPSTVGAAGPHSFIFRDSLGRPGRWNPCAPITWLFNTDHGPSGAEEFLGDGFAYAGAITGLTFGYGGTTALAPGTRVPRTIIVGWRPGIGAAGTATPFVGPAPAGTIRIVAGAIELNADLNDSTDLGPFTVGGMELSWSKGGWGPVLLHEIAHSVGLGHVDDPGQLMHPASGDRSTYGPGDLAGLHQVSAAAGCP